MTETMTIETYRSAILKTGKKKGDDAKAKMGWLLIDFARRHGLTLVQEHRFCPERKWRADWALWGRTPGGKEIRCLIEYEGLLSDISRHTTLKGYTADTAKYNRASILGWTILRYTAKSFTKLGRDLEYIIHGKKEKV